MSGVRPPRAGDVCTRVGDLVMVGKCAHCGEAVADFRPPSSVLCQICTQNTIMVAEVISTLPKDFHFFTSAYLLHFLETEMERAKMSSFDQNTWLKSEKRMWFLDLINKYLVLVKNL